MDLFLKGIGRKYLEGYQVNDRNEAILFQENEGQTNNGFEIY